MKKLSILLIGMLLSIAMQAQVVPTSNLYKTLYTNDSLLFNVGFNTCDISQFEKLVSENLEFYHDQSGVISSKEQFLENTKNGLCKLDYQPIRRLVEGSLQVFPMSNNGELYGAIQTGQHRFYAKYEGQEEEKLTSTADFTHLWLLEDGAWKLARVLSYNHQAK